MSAIQFLPHQFRLINNLTDQDVALVGGYGSGKTRALAGWAIHRSSMNPKHVPTLMVSLTLKIAKRTLVPAFRFLFDEIGCWYKLHKTDWVITWGPERREIWLESAEIPENLSGPNVGCAGIDEFMLMDEEVNRRVSSRVRHPDSVIRQVAYSGTPEGGGWGYAKIRECATVYARSMDNVFLPEDSMARLRNLYKGDPQRFSMYVEGKPMKISGNIYTSFDASKHVKRLERHEHGTLVLGADFNVGFMCTPIARFCNGELHVFDEVISRNTNTEDHFKRVRDHLLSKSLAKIGQTQFFSGLVANNQPVDIWVDASSTARKSSSTTTDRNILAEMGFNPRHKKSNPLVRDRIETVQYALSSSKMFFDPDARFCIEAISEHDYQPGTNPPQPRKDFGEGRDPLDAAMDAIGYMAVGVIPVLRPGVGRAG